MFDQNKPMPKIGVDMFAFALLKTDPVDGLPTYGEVVRVPGTVQVGFNPNSQTGTFHADNSAYATTAQTGDLALSVGLADIPPPLRAIWFGQKYENGVLSEGQINPPDMAIGYRIKKANGAYRYIWILKAKAAPPAESNDTQGSSVSFQSDSITFNCAALVSTGLFRRVLDDNDPGLSPGTNPATIRAGWFTGPLWEPNGTTPGGFGGLHGALAEFTNEQLSKMTHAELNQGKKPPKEAATTKKAAKSAAETPEDGEKGESDKGAQEDDEDKESQKKV